MSEIAILVPLMRQHRIGSVVETILESTDNPHIVVIATGECADAARVLPVTLVEDDGGTWPQRINRGYAATTEPYIFTGADDLAFRPAWFEAARRVLDTIDGGGVVAVNDLHNRAGVHFVFSKSYIESIGGVIDQPPGTVVSEVYAHAYCDDEIRATATFHNRYGGVVNDSIVEHLHPGAGKSQSDEIYSMGERTMSEGCSMYHSRAHLWATT